jgi:cytochrome P450
MNINVPEPIVKAPLPDGSHEISSDKSPGWSSGMKNSPIVATAAPADTLITSLAQKLRMWVYQLLCFGLCHVLPFKLFFALLRRVRPLALLGGTLWVTKADDVREVLARFDDFLLGQVIEPGMPWGQFIMTIDWRQQHALERGLLQSAVKPAVDIQAIRSIAAEECRKQAGALMAAGRIDAVARLAEPVAVRIAAEYFGVTPLNGSPLRMADAMADLAGIIMVNPPVGSVPWASSRDSIAGVTNQLLGQIAAAKAAIGRGEGAELPDTLLTRLVRLLCAGNQPPWFDDDWIRRYLTGLVGTGGATIVRATAHAIDQLLAHPDGLRQAQAVAARLDQSPDDQPLIAELRQLIYEALRFRPMLPLLVRDCPRDTVIAAGTSRARVVPGGTRVMAAPLAAMFDPQQVEAPWQFRAGRPAEAYLLFGHGDRSCFGRYIADTAMLEIIRFVLRLPGLARATGSEGQVGYGGPAARSLTVTFRGSNEAGTL